MLTAVFVNLGESLRVEVEELGCLGGELTLCDRAKSSSNGLEGCLFERLRGSGK